MSYIHIICYINPAPIQGASKPPDVFLIADSMVNLQTTSSENVEP